jgi:hypothetical protein
MLQLNVHQRPILFQNRTNLQFYDSFTWTVTQHNHWCTHTSTTEYKHTEEHSVLPTKSPFNVANINSIPQFLSVSIILSIGFPPRRPGFKSGSDHVGFCDGQKWHWGRFSPGTSVPPANLHSICFSTIRLSSVSPEAGTICQEWPQCQ